MAERAQVVEMHALERHGRAAFKAHGTLFLIGIYVANDCDHRILPSNVSRDFSSNWIQKVS